MQEEREKKWREEEAYEKFWNSLSEHNREVCCREMTGDYYDYRDALLEAEEYGDDYDY